MSTEDNNDPDPAEVKKTLEQLGWKAEQKENKESVQEERPADDPLRALNIDEHADVVTIPIPEETLAGMQPPEKERIRHLAGGVPDPSAEESEKKKELDPWSRDVPELGKVTVTLDELEQYTRALLFDERLELTVGLWMGRDVFKVRVRSLFVFEKEVLALTVAKIAEGYPIKTIHNASVIGDYWMKLSVLAQITEIQGTKQECYDARPEPGQLPEESPKVAELVRLARTKFVDVHQAKLKAMIRALHIFETKQQILEDAFHNRDFPLPADAC